MRGIAIEGIARMGDPAKLSEVETALRGERNDTLLLAGAFATAMLTDAPIDAVAEGLSRPKLRDLAKQYLVEITTKRPTVLGHQAQDPDAKANPFMFRFEALQNDSVRYAGQPIAVVIAETLEAATEAAALLAPRYAA